MSSMGTVAAQQVEILAELRAIREMIGKLGKVNGKDDTSVRLRDAGKPEYLNTSRATIYKLREDAEFSRRVPIFYLGDIPYVLERDLVAFKAFLHQRALATGKPRVGRPRKPKTQKGLQS